MKDPFINHIEQMKTITPIFSFDSKKSFAEQKKRIYEKYLELIKIPAKQTRPIPVIEYEDTTNSEFSRQLSFQRLRANALWLQNILFCKLLVTKVHNIN